MKDNNDLDIKELEKQLADISPSELSEGLLSRMENAMASWETHLPIEEKIVQFDSISTKPSTKKNSFVAWGAAAAIALMAAITSIFMIDSDSSNSPNEFVANPSLNQPLAQAPATLPKNFSHNLTNASNEGITYAGEDQQPYQVIKIEYTKNVKRKDKSGKTVTTKEKAVELILLPIQVH